MWRQRVALVRHSLQAATSFWRQPSSSCQATGAPAKGDRAQARRLVNIPVHFEHDRALTHCQQPLPSQSQLGGTGVHDFGRTVAGRRARSLECRNAAPSTDSRGANDCSAMKKRMPGSALPPDTDMAIMLARAAFLTLTTTASVSGATHCRTAPSPLARTHSRTPIISDPNKPNWERTAIGQLDALELPNPTPRPLVSRNDFRLFTFQ